MKIDLDIIYKKIPQEYRGVDLIIKEMERDVFYAAHPDLPPLKFDNTKHEPQKTEWIVTPSLPFDF